jgi:NAD+ kinase
MSQPSRLALLASDTPRAQEAAEAYRARESFVSEAEAEAVIVLGGDGFMLQTLHRMLDSGRVLPAYGINQGTIGFLMNHPRGTRTLAERVARARRIAVAPLEMTATTGSGKQESFYAINEVSLLRETRQTARLEVSVNGKIRVPDLACDGILVATPAGSTAYNLSANGPILPLGSNMLALTPISPFRPRRWRGAILRAGTEVKFEVLDPYKRPISATADSNEVRDVVEVTVRESRSATVTLLFDPEHSLEERILNEQFAY